jgi:hypothetical protein
MTEITDSTLLHFKREGCSIAEIAAFAACGPETAAERIWAARVAEQSVRPLERDMARSGEVVE